MDKEIIEIEVDVEKKYGALMKGLESSPFISTDWPMQGGVYRQYSAYENNESYPSGTSSSIRSMRYE